MDILTALHTLESSEARLEPAAGERIQIDQAHLLPQEALLALRDHKALLMPMVYGPTSCYIPGHLLPLDLEDAKIMAIYHWPLEGGVGIAQRKGADDWLWYTQHAPDATKERGTATEFMARLVELGVREQS
jgi:hypothetical protein